MLTQTLTQEQVKAFHQDGFLLVPNALTPDQVAWLRAFLRPKFDTPSYLRYPGDSLRFNFHLFGRHPELSWLLFHEPTLQALRGLLGENFVFMRESGAHLDHFATWHKDTSAQERAGHTFQWQPGYLMVQAAYYLQDNDPEWGGGLDVEVGSHEWPMSSLQKPEAEKKIYSIPSKAGDLLIFHYRINHQATPRRRPADPAHEKLAIFQACSSNSPHVASYHQFIGSRPDYTYLRGFRYPDEVVQRARELGVTLA